MLANRIRNFEKEAEDQAKEIISDAMQRLSHEVTAEGTTSNVELPKEELKGKIIVKYDDDGNLVFDALASNVKEEVEAHVTAWIAKRSHK